MTWLQTGSDRAFDLLKPDPAQVDFDIDVAEALARIARFTGHVRSGPYSVAQHSAVGADVVFRDTGSREAAAAFLLHDGRECALGDKSSPVKWAEIAIVREMFGETAASQIRLALVELGKRADRAIYAAAGMGPDGCPERWRALVHEYDIRMLATERRLLGRSPAPWVPEIENAKPLRLPYPLIVWPWPKAADEFRERLRRYLPERFGPARTSPKPGPRREGARRSRCLQEA